MGKTTNPASVFGYGNIGSGNNSDYMIGNGSCNTLGQFYGRTDRYTDAVKTFYCENLYGNAYKRTAGYLNVNGVYYLKKTPPYKLDGTYDGYENCGSVPASGYVKDLRLTSVGFVPDTTGAASNEYTCALCQSDSGVNQLYVGGACNTLFYNDVYDPIWVTFIFTSGDGWPTGHALYLYN